MIEMTITEIQFQSRAFISHLSELLRKQKDGVKEVQGQSLESEIARTERRLNDLKELVKRKIHESE